MEPLKKYRKSGLEHFIKFVRDLPLLSPQAIFARLEELGYRGQREARRAVSLMAYRHVRRIRRIYLDGAKREQLLPKSNTLLIGPTGCGKTHLVELLFREILRLPTVIVDITTYSETGYVGQDPSTILTRLLHAADDNPLLASIGIVCLDEFDKIASGQNNAIFAGAGTTKDVTGLGVQRELLKMLESSEVVVPLELTHSSYGDHVVMSTADIAFVAAGAFSGLSPGGRAARLARAHRASARNPKAVQVARRHRRQLHGRGGRARRQLPGLRLPARAAGAVHPLRPVRGARRRHADGDPEHQRDRSPDARVRGRGLRARGRGAGAGSHRRREPVARDRRARPGVDPDPHLEDVAFESFAEKRGGRIKVVLEKGKIRVESDTN